MNIPECGTRTLNNFHSDERFIPRRSSNDAAIDIKYFIRDSDPTDDEDLLTQDIRRNSKDLYREKLQEVLDLPMPSSNILYYGPNPSKKRKVTSIKASWPCKPRTRPLISAPDCALDLPDFISTHCFSLLDWGAQGYLAASLHKEIFLCHPEKRLTIHLLDLNVYGESENLCTSIKWNEDGKILALGTNHSLIECWDTATKKKLGTNRCCCARQGWCSITNIVWVENNKIILSGCSRGTIMSTNVDNMSSDVTVSLAHDGNIICMSGSPDGSHLASAGEDYSIRIWKIPQLIQCFRIVQEISSLSLSWHPWQPSLLAVSGGSHPGGVMLINAMSRKILSEYKPKTHCIVTALKWSKLTGELVASFWVSNGNDWLADGGHSEVLVLSSMTKVVDRFLSGAAAHVLQLLWSPDGMKLATASTDETLRIWSFMGSEEKKLRNSKHGKMKSRNSFLSRAILR